MFISQENCPQRTYDQFPLSIWNLPTSITAISNLFPPKCQNTSYQKLGICLFPTSSSGK